VLLIRAAGGQIGTGDNTDSALIFELKLIQTVSQRMTWHAKALFEVSSNSPGIYDIDSGVSFGTSIVSRLRDDRVLLGCPTLAAGWPKLRSGCMVERQRVLAKAQQEVDLSERMRLISFAPICR
jgi:hypothetical protein